MSAESSLLNEHRGNARAPSPTTTVSTRTVRSTTGMRPRMVRPCLLFLLLFLERLQIGSWTKAASSTQTYLVVSSHSFSPRRMAARASPLLATSTTGQSQQLVSKPSIYTQLVRSAFADGAHFTLMFFSDDSRYTVKTGRWAGVVTAFITMSDVRDEIDWEFPGANTTQGQSNYFWQGLIRMSTSPHYL
jgi:hypothetical protein